MRTFRVFLSIIILILPVIAFSQDAVHVMRKGDTLFAIAKKYGVAYEDIVRENGIKDADRIQIGQKIRIPISGAAPKTSGTKHRVEKGETLYGIARRYGVSVASLRASNGLSEKSVLKEGDILLVATTVAETGKKENPPASTAGRPGSEAKIATENPAVQNPPAKNPAAQKPAAGAGPEATSASKTDSVPRSLVSRSTDPDLVWPIKAKGISYMSGKLYGVIISGERAESVRSLSAGIVVSSGPYRGFGQVSIVKSNDGHTYVYGGMDGLSVKEGDRVAPGAALGFLGTDAVSGKAQLFFLVYKGSLAIDPAKAPRA